MIRSKIVALLALISSQSLVAMQTSDAPNLNAPSARDLYVGCYLVIKGDELAHKERIGSSKAYSADRCVMQSALTMAMFRNKPDGFCPQANVEFEADPIRSMASMYLAFYESRAAGAGSLGGSGVMLYAAQQKWPCN